jgi:gliding motility-associated-like protein
MLYRLLTLFFLQLGYLSYCQIVHLCQSDSLVNFSVIPSSYSNPLEWEFISGNGAEIIHGQFSDSITVNFPSAGDYILQMREFGSPNCFTPVDLIVRVSPNPLAVFSSNQVCMYDTVEFFNTSIASDGIHSSEWRIGDEIIDALNLSYKFSEMGEYLIELSVVSNSGCSDSESLILNLSDRPLADFYHYPEKITTLNPEVEFVNLSSEGTISWNFGDNSFSDEWQPLHHFNAAGWYDVELTLEDENGCVDSMFKSLFVESELVFYLPTSFTPDGDGLNDEFGLRGFNTDRMQEFHFEITNRWGEIIYSVDDVNQHWNGKTIHGNDAMSGTYLWSIRLKDELGKLSREIGEVTLLR